MAYDISKFELEYLLAELYNNAKIIEPKSALDKPEKLTPEQARQHLYSGIDRNITVLNGRAIYCGFFLNQSEADPRRYNDLNGPSAFENVVNGLRAKILLQEELFRVLDDGNFEEFIKKFKQFEPILGYGPIKSRDYSSYNTIEHPPFLHLLSSFIRDYQLHALLLKCKNAQEVTKIISESHPEYSRLASRIKILDYFLGQIPIDHPAFVGKNILNNLIEWGYSYRENNLWFIEKMLSSGKSAILRAEINANQNGATPLRTAIKRNRTSIIECLISLGAKISLQDDNGDTVLHTLLGDYYIKLEDKMKLFRIMLEKASKEEVEKALLMSNHKGETIIHLLVKLVSVELLKLVSSIMGREPFAKIATMRDKNNSTVMHFAAEIRSDQSSLSMYEYLFSIKSDWDVNEPGLYHEVCWKKVIENSLRGFFRREYDEDVAFQQKTLEFLVSKGASINSVDKFNNTVLHKVVQDGHIGLVEFLLQNKADPNLLDYSGLSPLDYTRSEIVNGSRSRWLRNEARDMKKYQQIAKILVSAGAKELEMPRYPLPQMDSKLMLEYSEQEKQEIENSLSLSKEEHESLERDCKIIQEIFDGLRYDTILCNSQQEIKEIREKNPDSYFFTEPTEECSSACSATLYQGIFTGKQEASLIEARKAIEDYNHSMEYYHEKIRSLHAKSVQYKACATKQECKEAVEAHGGENVMIGYDGGTGYQELHVYTQSISSCDEAPAKVSSGAYEIVCEQRTEPATTSQLERRRVYHKLDPVEINLIAQAKANIQKHAQSIAAALLKVEVECQGVTSRKFRLRREYEKNQLKVPGLNDKGTHFWLISAPYADRLTPFTFYQKPSRKQQATIDAILARTKPVILKNKLGFDLLHFNMSRHLKHVNSKMAMEHTKQILNSLRAKIRELQCKQECNSEVKELQADIFLLERRLQDFDKHCALTEKHSGISRFDQYLSEKSKKPKYLAKIGNHTLEFIDLRGEEDYLFFINTILTRPSRLKRLVEGEPEFFDFAGFVSTCLMDCNTRGFAGGHQANLLFPINMALSVPVELIDYLGNTDIGSPYNCHTISKIMYLQRTSPTRMKMDLRQAMYQLKVLEKDPMRIIPDCPHTVQKALRKDPSFKLPHYKYMGSLPLYTIEGLLKDTCFDPSDGNSYCEGIIKTNTFASSGFKLEGRLLIVEQYFLDQYFKEKHGKFAPEYEKGAEESLEILANIHSLTKGRLQLALVETNLKGYIAKLPPKEQAEKLEQEISSIVESMEVLKLGIKRFEMSGSLPPPKMASDLAKSEAQYRSLCVMYKQLSASLQKPSSTNSNRAIASKNQNAFTPLYSHNPSHGGDKGAPQSRDTRDTSRDTKKEASQKPTVIFTMNA